MQCTPDLSELSCSNCLEGATNEIPTCDSRKGGRVVKPSCNLRYEIYRFYDFTAANAPQQAPATPRPSPSSPSADLTPLPSVNTTLSQGGCLWTHVFHHVRSHSRDETRFLCVIVGKPFNKTVWSRHLFLFYFEGKNKIRKKNPKCDS